MNKVLLISHMPPPTTGIGSWTERVLECGIEGWDIGFVNSNMIGGRDPFKNTKIKLLDEIKRNYSIWKNEIRELKADREYKVVHTNIPCTVNGMLRESITGIIAKVFHKKFIVHCHCTLTNVENTNFKRFVFRIFSCVVDGYIVLNKSSEAFVKRNCRKKVKIIPNFVKKTELPLLESREIRKKVKDVLFVGGVSPDKGCDTVIEAAKTLPEYVFHFVGIVSSEIKNMDIPQNVIFYGNKDKDFVKDIMMKSDVFVFLSRFYGEGFSVALVEAMSSGLPCIVTDWAANADMIMPNGGVVVPQKSPKVFSEKIKELDNDWEFRKIASASNINKVHDLYVEDVVLTSISDFYNTVCDAKVRI